MFTVKVEITLKKTVADPQGLTIKHALESLGHQNVEDVRIGKLVTLKADFKDKTAAEAKVTDMCKKLLANPIIEDYRFTIEEV